MGYCSKVISIFVCSGHLGFMLISEFPVIIQIHNLFGLKLLQSVLISVIHYIISYNVVEHDIFVVTKYFTAII